MKKNSNYSDPDIHKQQFYRNLLIRAAANDTEKEVRYNRIVKPTLELEGTSEKSALPVGIEMFFLGVDTGIDFRDQSKKDFV